MDVPRKGEKLESMYYKFGEDDAVGVIDMPDGASSGRGDRGDPR
jgi:uncharacterized protein with GYD domain